MVGRPGRSKGCITCRKRHLKCDEAKPNCARCGQNGYHCDGYVEVEFVSENNRFSQIRSKPSSSLRLSSARPKSTSQSLGKTSVVLLRRQPSISSMRDEICLSYFTSTLFPAGGNADIPPWPGLRAVDDENSLAYRCLQSLAKVYFGRTQNAPNILLEGSQTYVQSLSVLNAKLGNPLRRGDPETLLSITILTLYEMMVMSNTAGWINHALGLAGLIHELGPEMFVEGLPHVLFTANRFFTILASLAVSKATYLAEPKWKKTPWSKAPTDKGQVQGLLDLMAELPALKEKVENSMDLYGVFSKASQLLLDLQSWRRKWDSSHQAPVAATPPERKGDENENDNSNNYTPSTIRSNLTYQSMQDANAVSNYDAILILAVELMTATSFSTPWPEQTEREIQVALKLSQEAAVEIARSIDAQTQGPYSMTGQFMALYAMRMAWKAFSGSATPEGRWVERKLVGFASSKCHWHVVRETLR